MSDDAHEFDVTVTVRKRVWVGVGSAGREAARELLTQALRGGMSFGSFVKRNEQGHPIETVLSNDIVLEDPTP